MLTYELISLITQAMLRTGLYCTTPIIANGKIQRYRMNSDKGKPCWYVVHVLGNGLVYVIFGCWKRGIYETWCSKDANTLSAYDKSCLKQAQEQCKNERLDKQTEAKKVVRYIWEHAQTNFADHAYLTRKQVKSFGLRLYKGMLLVPLYNENNELRSLQFIAASGDKWFKKYAPSKGGFFIIGDVSEIICIAEGYATAASIHEATGYAVVVAFNANNLLPVAQIFRKKFPVHEIILCADNDAFGGAQ